MMMVLCTLLVACSSSDNDTDTGEPDGGPVVATCSDGVQNGNETGLDCGGTCPNCPSPPSGVVIPTKGFDAPISYDGYTMVFSDEFNDDNLSLQKWSFNIGDGCPNLCGWGNEELQSYSNSKENLFFEEGNLIIAARNEGGSNYSSSRINTDNKFEFQYGRVDIRASMPSPKATWVALWLLNHNYTITNPGAWWPNGGEIDIMEYLGEKPTEVFGTAHYGVDFNSRRFNSKEYVAPNENYDKEYYVFSIVWEENKITWLVNDVEYHSITPSLTNGQPYPFNDEFYLIMNLSVGGNLPNASPLATDYPAFLIVDYIRVHQKN